MFNPHSVTLILGRRRVALSVASTRFPDIDMELGMREISPARKDVSSGRSYAHVLPCCSRIITVVRCQSSRVGDSGGSHHAGWWTGDWPVGSLKGGVVIRQDDGRENGIWLPASILASLVVKLSCPQITCS